MSLNSSILSFWKQSIWFGIQSADRLIFYLMSQSKATPRNTQ